MTSLDGLTARWAAAFGSGCQTIWVVLLILACSIPVLGEPSVIFSEPAPDVPALIKSGAEPAEVMMLLVKMGLERWSKVRDVQVMFTKRERLNGETERRGNEIIVLRERIEPWSVYMKWLDGPGKGRELAYVKGQNNNCFKVTPGGALGWVVVDRELDHPDVFKNARHTVTEAGVGRMLRRIEEQLILSQKDAVVVYVGETMVANRPCFRFLRFLPEKLAPNGVKYYCWKLDLCIDKELYLPVSVKCYGWKRQLDWQKEPYEEYTYRDFVFNKELGDEAFEVHASERPPDSPELTGK